MTKTRLICAVLLACATLFSALPTRAHEFLPAVAVLEFDRPANQYRMEIELNLEALIAEVEPELTDTNDSVNAARYDELRAMTPDQLMAEFEGFRQTLLDGIAITMDAPGGAAQIADLTIPPVGDFELARISTLQLAGDLPAAASTFQWQWDRAFGTISLKAESATSRESYVALLDPGVASAELAIDDLRARATGELFVDYIGVGFDHIIPKGLDHILFVIGIFLLAARWRPILWQVTAFTLAHTVTLGLGAAGYVSVPPEIVEPLIAASIVYVAVENIWRPTLSPWRPLVVFLFGLLHGLGFAGVLAEFGIPEEQFLVSLLAFNIGVELGQLAVIAVCFLLVGLWFRDKPWYRSRITIPASAAVAIMGAYWFVERTLL